MLLAARNLLYGPRKRGSGPSVPPIVARYLAWDSFVDQVQMISAKAGLSQPADTHPFPDLFDVVFNVRNHLMVIERPDGSNARIIPRQDNGLCGVGLYYCETELSSEQDCQYLDPGPTDFTSAADLESHLRPLLEEINLDYLELNLDGEELLQRLCDGEDIDFCVDVWNSAMSFAGRLDSALDAIDQGYDSEVINRQERTHLETLVGGTLDEEANLLAILAGDSRGQKLLSRARQLPVRVML